MADPINCTKGELYNYASCTCSAGVTPTNEFDELNELIEENNLVMRNECRECDDFSVHSYQSEIAYGSEPYPDAPPKPTTGELEAWVLATYPGNATINFNDLLRVISSSSIVTRTNTHVAPETPNNSCWNNMQTTYTLIQGLDDYGEHYGEYFSYWSVAVGVVATKTSYGPRTAGYECSECYMEKNGRCVPVVCPDGFEFDSDYLGCCVPTAYGPPDGCVDHIVADLIDCYNEPGIPGVPDTPYNPGDGPKPDCCRYMPKNFIPWSNGVGVPKLIPPNKRS